MSTRSAIVMKVKNGKYRGIYCHNDGYPEGVGRMLFMHYSGIVRMPHGVAFHQGRGELAHDKVNALLDLGDLSCLGRLVAPPPGAKHSFDHHVDDVTVAYNRDRGETGTEAKTGTTLKAVTDAIDHQYAYVFDRGRWLLNKKPLTLEDVGGR